MHRTVTAATELDVMQARARYSVSIDGVEQAVAADGVFEIQAGRQFLAALEAVFVSRRG